MGGLYSIHAYEPFAPQLARRLMTAHTNLSPLALSSTLLLTSNRRSIQFLRRHF